MGIYDRDYYREENTGQQSYHMRRPQSMIVILILINVGLFFANGLLTPDNQLVHFFSAKPDTLVKPWLWWQFLTYGFMHSPFPDFWHILGNMLVLFFLGPSVEEKYGPKEFLRFYLATIVVGGIVWSLFAYFTTPPDLYSKSILLGASGGVVGVVILFALNFPKQILYIWGIIPIPAWLLGVLFVAMDLFGFAGAGMSNVAYIVHLAGAAFAFVYFQSGMSLSQLGQGWSAPSRKKKYRVVSPDEEEKSEDPKMAAEVDRILEKIHRHGEESLTGSERKMLKKASRQFQKRRR